MLSAQHQAVAKQVAAAAQAVPTEDRGAFFNAVAKDLRLRGQGYTASLFEAIAKAYNEGRTP